MDVGLLSDLLRAYEVFEESKRLSLQCPKGALREERGLALTCFCSRVNRSPYDFAGELIGAEMGCE